MDRSKGRFQTTGLRLELTRWKEDAELLDLLPKGMGTVGH
jgi:hypothetical protein